MNYNNDTTISTPPGDILKVAILERRAFFINSVEQYMKDQSRGVTPNLQFINAGLMCLFLELADSLEKDLSKEEFEQLREKAVSNQSFDDALKTFASLSAFLYKKNVTKFDTRKEIESDDIEGNNKSHGF